MFKPTTFKKPLENLNGDQIEALKRLGMDGSDEIVQGILRYIANLELRVKSLEVVVSNV